MRRNAMLCIAMAASLTATMAARGQESGKASEQCQSNFVKEGGFLKGTTYRSHADYSGTDRGAVFEKAAQSLAADGWQMTNTNRDIGLITAIQQSVDGGRSGTLSTVVKQEGAGTVRTEMSFSLGPGMKAPDNAVRDSFCKVLGEIAHELEALPAGQNPSPESSIQTAVTETAAAPTSAPAGEQCQSNFIKEGGFLKGTTYRSHAEFSGMGRDVVFEKAAQGLAADGWQLTNVNKDIGLITAIQESVDGGRKSSLSTAVKQQGAAAVRVEMSFSLGPGMKAPDNAVRDSFCKVLGGITL